MYTIMIKHKDKSYSDLTKLVLVVPISDYGIFPSFDLT